MAGPDGCPGFMSKMGVFASVLVSALAKVCAAVAQGVFTACLALLAWLAGMVVAANRAYNRCPAFRVARACARATLRVAPETLRDIFRAAFAAPFGPLAALVLLVVLALGVVFTAKYWLPAALAVLVVAYGAGPATAVREWALERLKGGAAA